MRLRAGLAWAAVTLAIAAPIAIAATSPFLASRDAVYIVAGLAGIAALALLLMQPLLAAGYLPGLTKRRERLWHRRIGTGIVLAVALHVIGLYITSPPDALDALLLVSPTPFSVYGVIGLWSVVLTAILVALRRRIAPNPWRIVHNALAVVVVISSIVHALMIEGTMGAWSKTILCALIVAATTIAIVHLRVVSPLRKAR